MYRNKTICGSNVDFNLHSFCVGHIFTVFNFPLAIYTAFLNFLWHYLSWSLGLVLSTLLQLGIFEMGKKKQNTYNESKVLHPLLDPLCYSHNAWKERKTPVSLVNNDLLLTSKVLTKSVLQAGIFRHCAPNCCRPFETFTYNSIDSRVLNKSWTVAIKRLLYQIPVGTGPREKI